MSLSIIIPVYNNWSLTKSCLKDLSKLPEHHEIIVVDDGSVDRTKSLEHYLEMDDVNSRYHEREYHPNIKVIKNEKNMGFAFSVNRGYAAATKEKILFLNNDIRVLPTFKKTWTEELINKLDEDGLFGPTIGILGSDLNFKTETDKIPKKGLYYLSGWFIAAHKKTWMRFVENDCNPWWEGAKTFFEDTDLSFRAIEKGIPINVIKVPLKHIGHATAKKLDINSMYNEARVKFCARWAGNKVYKLLKESNVK